MKIVANARRRGEHHVIQRVRDWREAANRLGRPNVAAGRPNVAAGRPNVAAGCPNVAAGCPNVAAGCPNVAAGRDLGSGNAVCDEFLFPRERARVERRQLAGRELDVGDVRQQHALECAYGVGADVGVQQERNAPARKPGDSVERAWQQLRDRKSRIDNLGGRNWIV